MQIQYFSFGFIGYQVSMWNLLHISSLCFICYLVGYVKPFFYIFLVFVLYVTRWVCETLFIYFQFLFYTLRGGYVKPFLYSLNCCFIRYEVGMCNPFNLFCFWFIRYGVGMLNPLYSFQLLVLYVTGWVCETLFMYFYFLFYMLHSGYVKPSFMLFLSNISNACITHFVCQKVVW